MDVGPGNLTAVRTGVAYGNGLAFALGAGVATANSLELMAAQAGPGVPVLCLRNAGAGRAYAGWFAGAASADYRHGPLAEVVRMVSGPEVVVAGDFRTEVRRPAARRAGQGLRHRRPGRTGAALGHRRPPDPRPDPGARRDPAHGAVPAVRRDR